MHNIARHPVALLIAAVPFALLSGSLSAQPAHGTAVTTSITTDSGGRKNTVSIQVEVLNSKFRTSIAANQADGTQVAMYTIIDSAAGTLTTVMPAQSMAMIMPSSMMKPATAMTPPYTIELVGAPKSEIRDLGAGPAILGFPTEHFTQIVSYTSKITIGDVSCTKLSRDESEVWTTTAVKLPDLAATVKGFTGAQNPAVQMQKLDSVRNRSMKGAILRRVGSTTTTSPSGESQKVGTTMEITALSPDSVDPADFEIPAGFQVMDMATMMGAGDPATVQEALFSAQLNAGEKMKQSLCGDSSKP